MLYLNYDFNIYLLDACLQKEFLESAAIEVYKQDKTINHSHLLPKR